MREVHKFTILPLILAGVGVAALVGTPKGGSQHHEGRPLFHENLIINKNGKMGTRREVK